MWAPLHFRQSYTVHRSCHQVACEWNNWKLLDESTGTDDAADATVAHEARAVYGYAQHTVHRRNVTYGHLDHRVLAATLLGTPP